MTRDLEAMAGTDRWRARVLSTFEGWTGTARRAEDAGMSRGKPGGSKAAGRTGEWVALLRGVNVGGRHRLSMEALAGYFEEAGCTGVRTVIQSGNVLFRASASVARAAPERVSARIHQEHGHRPPMVVRSAAELAKVAAGNPLLAGGCDEELLHVVFLARKPAAAAVAALDPARSLGDRFVVRGSEVFLYLPRGVSGTKLTVDYLDRTLGTMGTWRNWRSVRRLTER
jgi:uncharacterized protein (DUF1697 family)